MNYVITLFVVKLNVVFDENCLTLQQTAVVRSVSDVSDLNGEEKRRKPTRRRRTKPYKSDPFDNISKLDGETLHIY